MPEEDEQILRRMQLMEDAAGGPSVYDRVTPAKGVDPALAKTTTTPTVDASDVAEKTDEKGNWGAAATAAKGVATEKSAAGKAGSGLMAAGMATSDPYLVAGGAGLSAVGAIQDQKNERRAKQMQKRNERRQQIIAALGGFRNAVV